MLPLPILLKQNRYRWFLALLTTGVLSIDCAVAQVIPDNTLGSESSQVIPNGITVEGAAADLIRAGAQRGANLFHSFERFSVGAGQRVYFESPAGVERVFSRVTGNLRSDIFGTLGISGGADLFLLNPNGIVFGPNARLDVSGSFAASTADRFAFADGSVFNATALEAPLLTISVPLGVQFNTQPQNQPIGDVTNQANLAVGPGQTLTLFGNAVSSTVRLAAPDGSAQVLGNQVELIDSESSGLFGPSGNTALRFEAADGITVADIADNALRFAQGAGQIVLAADADADGVGDVVMLDLQDALQTNGRDLAISGVNLTLGIIDTSVQRDIVGGEIVDVDAGGPLLDASDSGVGIASFTFTVPAGVASIDDLDVRFSAEHTFNNDLSAALTSPNGTSLSLFSTVGGSGDNFQDTILDDDASQSVAAGSAPFDGRFQPEGDGGLAVFDGQLSGGTWTLTVTDDAVGDSGRLLQAGDLAPWGAAQGTQLVINATSIGGVGNGGAVELTAEGSIAAAGIDAMSSDSRGGDVALLAGGTVQVGALGIDASGGEGSGNGGQIQIVADGSIELLGAVDASASSLSGASGNGGAVTISSASGDILIADAVNSFSFADPNSSGNGGAISIASQEGAVTISGSLNSSSTSVADAASGDSGDGGAISISSDSGDITINSAIASESDAVAISGSDAVSGNSGNGGAITIDSRSGDIMFNGSLSSGSASSSLSGEALETPMESSAVSGDSGNGGDVTITSRFGTIAINSNLFTASSSIATATSTAVSNAVSGESGNGGDITIASRSGDIAINSFTLGSRSFSSSDAFTTTNVQAFSADLSAGDSGDSGNITITSRSGDIMLNQSRLSATSFSIVNAFYSSENSEPEAIEPLSGDGIALLSGDSGNGGTIAIASRFGNITADNDLRTFSFSSSGGAGRAGDISVSATEGAIVGDSVQLAAFSVAEAGGDTGDAGTVALTSNAISGLEIITLASNGQSGGVNIQSIGEALTVSNLSLVTSGQVEIPDPFQIGGEPLELDLDDFGQAGDTSIESAGNIAFDDVEIQADANGSRPAGGVTITSPAQVTLTDSQINSSTNSTGSAGEIAIKAEQLTIDSSAIDSSTGPGSTGQGGNIMVMVGGTTLRNGGHIAVNSAGQGQGGSIVVMGDRLVLIDNSSVSATTLNSDGGDITLTLNDLLALSNNSVISTEAGTDEAGGDGGDIGITTGFLTGSGNSDIVANAFDGMGGNIDIVASRGLFGIAPRRFRTIQSDITASSQNGVFGNIIIQSPEIDPSQSTVELPIAFAAPEVVRSCRETLVQSGSEFIVSGRGGIPQGPLNSVAAALWQDLSPIEAEGADVVERGQRSDSNTSAVTASAPLTEAQGWVKNALGQIVLVAEDQQPLTLASSLTCDR